MRTCNLIPILATLLLAGCLHPLQPVFAPLANAPVWPTSPDTPRIRYVGQLSGSQDLKAPVSPLKGVGDALFGADATYSFVNPMAVCTDNGARVFVADPGDHVIHMLNLETRQYARWSVPNHLLQSPVGLAFDAGGRRLLVSDSAAKTIFIFDNAGTYAGDLGKGVLVHPCGLTVNPANGSILVVDVALHQIIVFSPAGQVISRLGTRGDSLGTFNYPTNIALDHRGRAYVSDSLNFRVQQFSPQLAPLRQIGKQGDMPGYFSQPKGLSLDTEDHLYVVDSQFEAIQIFSDTGALLLNFGESGKGAGQFWLPTAIYVDHRNRIWVADSSNRRIQVFDYLPEVKP